MTANATTTRTPDITTEITGDVLRISGSNGDVIALAVSELPPEIRHAAMMHGLKQKIGDAAAISRNTETGRSATVADKFAAMHEVYQRLLAGQWNKTREAGDGGGAGGLLFKALCVVRKDKTAEEIRAYLASRTKEEQAALRKVPAIAEAIEEIRAAQAKSGGIDGEALLAGF